MYTVETIAGCKVVRGQVPLGDMAGLLGAAPEDAVMDLQLAGQMGATLVFGVREALDRLRALGIVGEGRQREVDEARAAGLSEGSVAWVLRGERGVSSESIFSYLTGVELRPREAYACPRDAADLSRCRLLIESSSECADRLGRLAELGPEWAELAERLMTVGAPEAPPTPASPGMR